MSFNPFFKASAVAFSVCAVVAGLSGCGHRDFVRGEYDENVESTNLLNDRWSETDMQKAVQDLVASAMKDPVIASARKPPVVMVTKLQNKTSEVIDTQNITDMVTVELSGSKMVKFIDKAAREDIADEYSYQDSGMVARDSKKGKGNQTGADLILNGRLDSIVQQAGKDKTVYYKLTLIMTNLSTGVIEWTDHKQIRKVFRKQHVGI
jgi:uncharacterized protein (TIGR02722 family)